MKNKRGGAAACLVIAAILALAAGVAAWRLAPAAKRGAEPAASGGGAVEFPWDTYAGKEASWWGTAEARALADEIVLYQLPDGGWRKDMKVEQGDPWGRATIDNNATWGHIRFLAKCHAAQGGEDLESACRKGIDFLLDIQYPNGGWPQIAGMAGKYHAHITFNDNAMTEVMRLLASVAARSEAEGFAWVDDELAGEAARAFDRGLACILRCQIRVNGELTAWCQQYDENTLEPAGGRAYELPAICTRESVGIVQLLESLPEKSPEVEAAIEAALRWFEAVGQRGVRFETVGDDRAVVRGAPEDRLWARFYELDGVTPLFSDRDGKKYYDVAEISRERRTGYDWYGTWPMAVLSEQ